jgi:hypothetical protein
MILCLAAYIYPSCKPVWQFDHLEQTAKKVVTASELQSWATNLLARNPTGTNLAPSDWGSDLPKKLLKLAPSLGPSICIYGKDDNNFICIGEVVCWELPDSRWVRLIS